MKFTTKEKGEVETIEFVESFEGIDLYANNMLIGFFDNDNGTFRIFKSNLLNQKIKLEIAN